MTTEAMPLIRTRGLKKAYPVGTKQLFVLNGVDIDVHAGECVAIMGPSGSGKSTLMHLLGCLDRPTEGGLWLMEKNILEMNENALANTRAHHIGFVFQSFNLIPPLTVLENVLLPFIYRDLPPEAGKKALEILERVGLGHRIHHRSNDLSGGEMQRVAIARALVIDPLLILADEPTGNLDVRTGDAILKLLQEQSQRGVTVIIVTHDPAVAEHCQRIIRMQDGKIVSQSSTVKPNSHENTLIPAAVS